MAKERKQSQPEQEPGAPEWMVTFSDCMTLLLTFFVLLLSFRSFDNQDDFLKMSSSFAQQISFGAKDLTEKEALAFMREQMPSYEIQQGSEKPTFSQEHLDQTKKMTPPADFLRYNTFITSSEEMFLGNTSAISAKGREALGAFATYLKEFPNYMVVISESGADSAEGPDDTGFQRGWSVMNFLTDQKGLDRRIFSLSAAGTAVKEYHASRSSEKDRMLEIVLLKRRQ